MSPRHYPQINGAAMERSVVRRCCEFPRAWDGAKPRAITHHSNAAPLAQTASRVTHPIRFAPCQRYAGGYACQGARSHRQGHPEHLASHLQSQAPARGARGRYSRACRHAHVDNQSHCSTSTRSSAISSVTARPVDSFAAIGRHSTAGSARTHQRPSYGLAPVDGQSLLHTGLRTVLIALSFASDRTNTLTKATVESHGRGPYRPLPIDRPEGTSARALSAITTLSERKTRERARGSQAPAGQILAVTPIFMEGCHRIESRGGWRKTSALVVYRPAVTLSRRLFPELSVYVRCVCVQPQDIAAHEAMGWHAGGIAGADLRTA
jgi:hypothetical protein